MKSDIEKYCDLSKFHQILLV